jgi:hypothetical protein
VLVKISAATIDASAVNITVASERMAADFTTAVGRCPKVAKESGSIRAAHDIVSAQVAVRDACERRA